MAASIDTMQLHVLALVLIITSGISGEDQSCIVEDFEVQQNFDVNKFAGRWYEISWVPFYFEPPFDNFLDFVEIYTVVNDTYMTAVSAGRVSLDAEDCIDKQRNFTVTDDKAKWNASFISQDNLFIVDYWIITTDYDHYAFAYGCTKLYPNGTCQFAHAWKWSRTQIIDQQYMDILNQAAETTCMGDIEFDDSKQSKDCFETSAGYPLYISMFIYLVMICHLI